jgi:hypothetical protein
VLGKTVVFTVRVSLDELSQSYMIEIKWVKTQKMVIIVWVF